MPNPLLVRKIKEAIIHENNTHYCYHLIMQTHLSQGFPADQATISNYVINVQNYIAQVSAVLDQFQTGAQNAGLSTEFQPIFLTAERLFMSPPIGIPDYLGLAGILDNAYLVFDFFINILGQNVFYPEFVQLHYAIRNMLGEPLASQLDNLVFNTVNSPRVLSAIQKIARGSGQMNAQDNPVYAQKESYSAEQPVPEYSKEKSPPAEEQKKPYQSVAPILNMMYNCHTQKMDIFRSAFR